MRQRLALTERVDREDIAHRAQHFRRRRRLAQDGFGAQCASALVPGFGAADDDDARARLQPEKLAPSPSR